MTKNEFKLFCICFCKKYEGKTFGEVLPDIKIGVEDVIIDLKYLYFNDYGNLFDFKKRVICIFRYSDSKCYQLDDGYNAKIPDNILKIEDIV